MTNEKTEVSEDFISDQVIQEQLQRIFTYPSFAVSVVLRNFLSYIVKETISGRSNDIKEYNVAVDVLGRPADFRTVHSGIVRVHARRLRRALYSYYRELGSDDPCIISIPTGRYVPVFAKPESADKKVFPELKSVSPVNAKEKIKMAVMPFRCFAQEDHRMAFADSIGLMLNEGLGSYPDLCLLSYFTTQQVKKNEDGIRGLVSDYDLAYVLSGNVHFDGPKIRVNFQLIEAQTETQLYSETYSLHFNSNNYFDLSDLIVSRVLDTLGEFGGWPGQQLMKYQPAETFKKSAKRKEFSIVTNKRIRSAIA